VRARARPARPPASNAPEIEASPHVGTTPGAWSWAALMRRVFDLDVLACPRCGGRLRVLTMRTMRPAEAIRPIGLAKRSDAMQATNFISSPSIVEIKAVRDPEYWWWTDAEATKLLVVLGARLGAAFYTLRWIGPRFPGHERARKSRGATAMEPPSALGTRSVLTALAMSRLSAARARLIAATRAGYPDSPVVSVSAEY
jgi:uncharacterized protein YbaR (Trm112 family)